MLIAVIAVNDFQCFSKKILYSHLMKAELVALLLEYFYWDSLLIIIDCNLDLLILSDMFVE